MQNYDKICLFASVISNCHHWKENLKKNYSYPEYNQDCYIQTVEKRKVLNKRISLKAHKIQHD